MGKTRGSHHFYTPAERATAANACREYRDRWALSVADMARQLSTTTVIVDNVEALRYGAGMGGTLAKLLVKDLYKKPRKMRN